MDLRVRAIPEDLLGQLVQQDRWVRAIPEDLLGQELLVDQQGQLDPRVRVIPVVQQVLLDQKVLQGQ